MNDDRQRWDEGGAERYPPRPWPAWLWLVPSHVFFFAIGVALSLQAAPCQP